MSKTYEALKRAEALRAGQQLETAAPALLPPATDLPVGGADDLYELRRRLIGSAVGDAVRTVLVVSALHGEGASSTACLLALYGPSTGPAIRAAAEAVFRMWAGDACFIMRGRKAWSPWITPQRLTPISHSQSRRSSSQMR